MMREGQTKGYISRQEARTFFRLEPAKAVRQAQPSFFLLFLCFLISYCLQAGARQGSQAGTTFLLLAVFSCFDLAVSCAAATSVVINPLTLQADFYQTTSNA